MNAAEERTACEEMTDTETAFSCLASKQNDDLMKFAFTAVYKCSTYALCLKSGDQSMNGLQAG